MLEPSQSGRCQPSAAALVERSLAAEHHGDICTTGITMNAAPGGLTYREAAEHRELTRLRPPVTPERMIWASELSADDVRDIREATAGNPHLERLLIHGLTHWTAT
jgi:hypothetical protein